MKKLVLSLVAITAINNHSFLIAQRGNCAGEHNFCFPGSMKGKGAGKDVWQYNNQSKSGLFAENETTEITLITYKDTEYMIAFCTDNEMLENKIQFKLYDFVTKQVEKTRKGTIEYADPTDTTGVRMLKRDTVYRDVAYEKTKKLLFDNTKKENIQHFEFISEKTRKILVEVFVPAVSGEGGEASTGKSKKKKGDEGGGDKEIQAATYSCVGMLIMHQKALVTGFQK